MSINDKISLCELIDCIDRNVKNSIDQSVNHSILLHLLEDGAIFSLKEHYEALGFDCALLAMNNNLLKITLTKIG